jgi:hypothetical protein
MSRLLGAPATLQAINDDKPLSDIRALWTPALDQFRARREKYLLYP